MTCKAKVSFNDRELATVLSALRMVQKRGVDAEVHDALFAEIDDAILDDSEIDHLCERINS
jgi:hypothetical protein